MQYVVGGEESYGYLVGDQCATRMRCRVAACSRSWPMNWTSAASVLDRLADLHRRHGAYKEGLVSLVKEGREGKAQIDAVMHGFRTSPPAELAGEKVVEILDFQTREGAVTPRRGASQFAPSASNVMQFVTEQGSRITVRPSGTEPKIKCYASVSEPWDGQGPHRDVMARLESRVQAHFARLASKVTDGRGQGGGPTLHRPKQHGRGF